jgi:hypothetical protein
MAIKKKQNSVSSATIKKISGSRDKPPPLDQWIKPAIGLAMAMLGYQFFRGMVQQEIKRVNIEDELELRQVLFGETIDDGSIPPAAPATTATPQNYAILCHPESATYPISSVFADAAKDGSAPAIFRVIDCDTVMAGSDKTIKERFDKNLNDKIRPLIFVSGKQGPPKQVKLEPGRICTLIVCV